MQDQQYSSLLPSSSSSPSRSRVSDLINFFSRKSEKSKSSTTTSTITAMDAKAPQTPIQEKSVTSAHVVEEVKEKRPSLLQRVSGLFKSPNDASSSIEQPKEDQSVTSSTQTSTSIRRSDDIPLMGVSLRWFINYTRTDERVLKSIEEKGENANLDIFLPIVKDLTREADESFTEMLLRTQPDKNLTKPKADLFISYARMYSVKDFIDAIESLLPTDGDKDIYVWFDIFTINQHEKGPFNPHFFTNVFRMAIATISNVAIVLTPWDSPGNLTRAWCIWELYSAAVSENVKIQILIPPSQLQPFRKALAYEPQQLMARIAKIDIEKAQAWSTSDRDMILDAARSVDGGVEKVREIVMTPLRNWMTNEALKTVEDMESMAFKGDELYSKEFHAKACNEAGLLIFSQGKFEEAEILYRKAIDLHKQVYGLNHVDTSTCLNNLANLLKLDGRYEEAVPIYKEVLEIDEKALGVDHPMIATSINNLAHLLYTQGNLDEAEPLFRRALEIKRKIYGNNNSPSVATSLNNLAGLLSKQGKIEEAEMMYKEALGILEQVYGTTHPDVGQCLNNIAMMLKYQSKYEEVETMFKRSLDIAKSAYGDNHPYLATCINNLAGLYYDQRRLDEAEVLMKESLEMREKLFGEYHPSVAESLNNLAVLLEMKQKYDEAEVMYKKVLLLLEMMLGKSHPNYIAGRDNLMDLLKKQGKDEEASRLME